MTGNSYARSLVLALTVLFGLVACNRQENGDSQRLQSDAYLDIAELYRSQGQYRAGIIEAQNALQAFPEYDRSRLFMSRLYMDVGDNGSAQQILESLLAENPFDAEVILLLAESHLYQRSRDEVLTLLEELETSTDEQLAQKFWLLGNAYGGNNNQLAAHESLEAGLQVDSAHTPSLITLSMLEWQAGNEFGAQEFIDRAIMTESDNLDLWIWRGQFALLQEKYLEAEEAFFEALQLMGSYDIMTPKRVAVMQAIIIPLQMQQKNAEALRYSGIISETPQGQFQESYNSAVSMFQQGEFEEAEKQLENLISQAPESSSSNVLLGLTRYAQGNYRGALESLAGLVSSETSSPEVIKVLAATHIRQNQSDQALSVLQEASVNFPQDGSLLAMIGISQQSLGDLEGSIESFKQALELQADSADLHFALAGSYSMNQDADSAIEHLNRTLEINPDYTQAKSTLVDIQLSNENFEEANTLVSGWISTEGETANNYNLAGRIQFVQNNFAEARRYFNSSLSLEPNNLAALLFSARTNIEEADYSEAVNNFKTALQIEPINIEALSGLISLGSLNGTTDARIAEVVQIIEGQPTQFIPPLVLSQYYLINDELDNAQIYAESAYARNDNSYTENTLLDILIRKIGIARQLEDLDAARELASYAQELRADNIQVLLSATAIESQAGEYREAALYLNRIKELQPEGSALGSELQGDLFQQQDEVESALNAYKEAWALGATANLGLKVHSALLSLERVDEAAAFLDEWEVVSPDDAALNLFRALDFQENNRIEEAIEHYEIAYDQQPDDIIVLNNLAWLYQDSNPSRALDLSARAANLYPDNANVLDTYGWILLNQNNREAAIPLLQRALELAPESASIAEHLEAAQQ